MNKMSFDNNYATTRLLIEEKQKIPNNPINKYRPVLFFSKSKSRQNQGGLRVNGYFKKSYPNKPLITIITVVFNGTKFLEKTIKSVINQTYDNIEYIIIDGGSTDGTLDIIKQYEYKINYWISEKDSGIYDAMNKGIKLATGDIIGILNSDDFYANDNVIQTVVDTFKRDNIDSLFADTVLVKPDNINKIVRYYDSSHFNPEKFAYGWMPAHPTFFCKKIVYEKYGLFRTDLKIAADFDILVRFLYTHKISYRYLQTTLVIMRMGGVSTSLSSIWINNIEVLKVCKDNGIQTNIFKIMSKYPKKILGMFKK